MQFSKQGDFYRVSSITGPTHNSLLVSFEEADDAGTTVPIIEVLPPIGECQHGKLDSDTILREVLEGVSEGNSRFGTNYRVKIVQYIENDTHPESVYRYLALKLVEYLANGGID